MKKKQIITIIAVVIVVLFAATFKFVLPTVEAKMVQMVLHYEPITLNDIYDNPHEKNETFFIFDNKNPTDYGYSNWEECSYPAWYDESIQLSAWFVHSAPSDTAPCLMLIHGRTSNRLKPMKYLKMFKDLGLDTVYNFMLVDNRNSGNSSPATTEMGNLFADDIAAACHYAHDRFNVRDFELYAFSMGAMGAAIFWNRPDFKEWRALRGVNIRKMIFDSPISNVEQTLFYQGGKMGAPKFLIRNAIASLSDSIVGIDGVSFLSQMRLSALLRDYPYPLLVLSNEYDNTLPVSALRDEIDALNLPNLEAAFFENKLKVENTHVNIYVQYENEYKERVNNFLK